MSTKTLSVMKLLTGWIFGGRLFKLPRRVRQVLLHSYKVFFFHFAFFLAAVRLPDETRWCFFLLHEFEPSGPPSLQVL